MADEQTRINALSGGAPLPQAATQTIARRLLGPGLADRYGDVIGTRPTNYGDIARDFATGFISGDPTKADQIKAQVAQSYNDELRREDDQRLQAEEGARQQMRGFFDLLQQGKKVPKDLRQDFFKEGLPKVGVEPTSPLFMKVLSNYEKFGDVYDALGDPEIQRLADEDPLGAVEQLVAMGHDGAAALQVAQSVQQMKRYRAGTQRIMSRAALAQSRTPQDPVAKARNAFIGKMGGRQITDEATGEKRTITAQEVLSMADQLYGAKPSSAAGIAQQPFPKAAESLPPGATGLGGTVPDPNTTTTSTTTAPTETSTPAAPAPAPVGIAQTASGQGDAVAAAKKRLGL